MTRQAKPKLALDPRAAAYAPPTWAQMPEPPEWQKQALCHQPGVREIFWAAEDELEKGGSIRTSPDNPVVQAQEVCEACPVRELCLESALAFEGRSEGYMRQCIYGGKTPADRERLSKGLPSKMVPRRPDPIMYRKRRPDWVGEAIRLRLAGHEVEDIALKVGRHRSNVGTQLAKAGVRVGRVSVRRATMPEQTD